MGGARVLDSSRGPLQRLWPAPPTSDDGTHFSDIYGRKVNPAASDFSDIYGRKVNVAASDDGTPGSFRLH